MNNFKKEGFRKGGNSFGGKPKFGGNNRFGDRDRGGDRGEREFFKATCASCHASCEVPFRPSGDKPVYCRECFGGKTDTNDRFSNRSDSRKSEFRPERRDDRSHERHEDHTPRTDAGVQDLKRQITNLEAKVDSILQLLKDKATPIIPVVVSEAVTSSKAPEVAKKAKTPTKKVAKVTAKAPAKKKVAAKKAKSK